MEKAEEKISRHTLSIKLAVVAEIEQGDMISKNKPGKSTVSRADVPYWFSFAGTGA